MLRSLELHTIFPQIGLALHNVTNDGSDTYYQISPLGNEHDVRKISQREFLKSYGNALKERLDEIELLHFQTDDVRLTADLCAALVRLGLKTEVIAAARDSDSPLKTLHQSIERDRTRLQKTTEENNQPTQLAQGNLAPGEPDLIELDQLTDLVQQYHNFHSMVQTRRRHEDPAFRVLWPVQRVGEAFLGRKFVETGLVENARDVAVRFSNSGPGNVDNPPYWPRARAPQFFEIPLEIDDWRLQVFVASLKDRRSWVKRTATRGLEMSSIWSLASVAETELEHEAERIAEFRRQQEESPVQEEIVEVIDEPARNEFVVGISSEGCVFGTMELQIKECFIPNFINGYRLQEISKYAREAAEFVNLYSKYRGINRFAALVEQLKLLRRRPEVRARGVKVPAPVGLMKWLSEERVPCNRTLEEAVQATGDPDLELALKWSKAVNKTISQVDHGVPPYPYVRETLKKFSAFADVLVISSMPNKILTREWQQHELATYVKALCGREAGSKSQSLSAAENFEEHHALMVGDSYADLAAAKANNCLFFPINPNAEEESWRKLYEEGVDRFLSETFAGDYQKALLEDFAKHLPAEPTWAPAESS